MIDIVSVLLGYLLGTFLTGALCVFLLGWTAGNLEDLRLSESRIQKNQEHEEQDSRSEHL